ncbi:hypothetical protein [Streptomyces odontomachi]|uniref:hypothetical protein n=1 Tax=Streptomyces odontomachi TaxID=2944940 RepID=UPI0021087185|nr:hypothetical protein [Streptomyces sp. ODS25]
MAEVRSGVHGDNHGQYAGRDLFNQSWRNEDRRSYTQVYVGSYGPGGKRCVTDAAVLPPRVKVGCGAPLKKTTVVFNENALSVLPRKGFIPRNNWAILARPPIEPESPSGGGPGAEPAKGVTSRQRAVVVFSACAAGGFGWALAAFTTSWAWYWTVLVGAPFLIAAWCLRYEWDDFPVGMRAFFSFICSTAVLQLLPVSMPMMATLLVVICGADLFFGFRREARYEYEEYLERVEKDTAYRKRKDRYDKDLSLWENSWFCTACGRKWVFRTA